MGQIGASDEPLKQREESESRYFRYYDFCGIDAFASIVDVAQKSFHVSHRIPLVTLCEPKVLRLFLVLLGLTLVGLLVAKGARPK